MGETYGVSTDEIVEGIRHVVRKVNIDTDLRMASAGAIRQSLANHPSVFHPRKYLQAATQSMQQVCMDRYEAFGTAGNASLLSIWR